MFPSITTLNDVLPFIAEKREIARISGPAGSLTLCYQFQDSETFDSPEAAECRGIVFDRHGNVAGRPLHKFFNLGEHGETAESVDWSKAERVMDKLDGSMIHTVWLDGRLFLKSKKCFDNAQTTMAKEWLFKPENAGVLQMCVDLASNGGTAIFELTSPANRIVVGYADTRMRLLHVRANMTGTYATPEMLDALAGIYGVELVDEPCTAAEALASLPAMTGKEGYVIQFPDGNMLKVKCPWYSQLHRTVSFTRERDIAEAALEERLDDIKAALAELGHDLGAVNAVEKRVMADLLWAKEQVDAIVSAAAGVERKQFALANNSHPLFGLLMPAFTGKTPSYTDWFKRNKLKQDYSLEPLTGTVLEDA